MNRRPAKRLFAIASRLLLALALVFSTGPWAAVLASAQAAACPHLMSDMQHAAGGDQDCCADARGAHDMPDCGKHASACAGICSAVCGLAGPGPVIAGTVSIALPAQPGAMSAGFSGANAPSLFAAPALRPPISL